MNKLVIIKCLTFISEFEFNVKIVNVHEYSYLLQNISFKIKHEEQISHAGWILILLCVYYTVYYTVYSANARLLTSTCSS